MASLEEWTSERIDACCHESYAAYEAALRDHYRSYFKRRPDLAGIHPLKARDIEAALPESAAFLAKHLPEKARHLHHLSGRSSQILALAVIGIARERDPSLRQLAGALSLEGSLTSPAPESRFEYELPAALLNEHPHVSSIDFLIEDESAVVCLEAKLGENGLGACGCSEDSRRRGDCSTKVRARERYWQTARDIFSLVERVDGSPCPISASYQAVRNCAAARALARSDRQAVFALVYDDRNPYFRQTGDWPGWPAMLRSTLAKAEERDLIKFRAVSWQNLVPLLPLTSSERAWLHEKHEIG